MATRLIRLHECAGLSASLWFAYGINRFCYDVALIRHVMTKPAFGIFDRVRLKPACSITEVSQSHEIAHIETKAIVLFRQRTTKALIRLRSCAGWSAPLLFSYGISRFSHNVAHMTTYIRIKEFLFLPISVRSVWTRLCLWFVGSLCGCLLFMLYIRIENQEITGPCHEKPCLRGLRSGKTQTGLLSCRN